MVNLVCSSILVGCVFFSSSLLGLGGFSVRSCSLTLRLGPSASVAGAGNKTDQLMAALTVIKELAEDPQLRGIIASQLALNVPAEVTPAAPEAAPAAENEAENSGMYGSEEGEEEEQEHDPVKEEVKEEEPEPPKPSVRAEINSSTRRNEHARLTRRMDSADQADCPEMLKLWSGNKAEKNQLLIKWIESGENLQACESTLTLERSQEGELEKGKELLTIREMVEKNFSQFLGDFWGSKEFSSTHGF